MLKQKGMKRTFFAAASVQRPADCDEFDVQREASLVFLALNTGLWFDWHLWLVDLGTMNRLSYNSSDRYWSSRSFCSVPWGFCIRLFERTEEEENWVVKVSWGITGFLSSSSFFLSFPFFSVPSSDSYIRYTIYIYALVHVSFTCWWKNSQQVPT